MKSLFNRDFFKFSFGFIGMILFGLLGIFLTGYLDSTQVHKNTSSDIIHEVLSNE